MPRFFKHSRQASDKSIDVHLQTPSYFLRVSLTGLHLHSARSKSSTTGRISRMTSFPAVANRSCFSRAWRRLALSKSAEHPGGTCPSAGPNQPLAMSNSFFRTSLCTFFRTACLRHPLYHSLRNPFDLRWSCHELALASRHVAS